MESVKITHHHYLLHKHTDLISFFPPPVTTSATVAQPAARCRPILMHHGAPPTSVPTAGCCPAVDPSPASYGPARDARHGHIGREWSYIFLF